ncbi:uncharacterized protein LOC117791243 [Drosophila innubila]|uniref:uncharacterized protein LOC117791243 n=1 Tax=Drosophila innubila TaxID=198719 RepID=UPI00148B83FE|nr:uncharacterized protein LOC117791243 [Drosophila innubila]
MTLRFLLIAAAVLICLCAADVSHINQKPPQDVLVPFNDLLPPPLEESTTTEKATEATEATKATKTTEATPASKPTKKSYYQQQARSKVMHLDVVDEKPKLQLALELLPPFAEAPASNESEQPQIEQVRTTTHQPLVDSRPTATTRKSVPHIEKPQLQQLQARVARPNSIASDSTVSSISSAKSGFSSDLITQYLTNFQFTTRRPSRGPLPTLTPFPHHIKK